MDGWMDGWMDRLIEEQETQSTKGKKRRAGPLPRIVITHYTGRVQYTHVRTHTHNYARQYIPHDIDYLCDGHGTYTGGRFVRAEGGRRGAE